MKNLILLTIVYLLGLPVFLLTGLCEVNLLFYLAIAIGLIGSILLILKRKTHRNR